MYAHIAPSYNALHGAEQERKIRILLSLCSQEFSTILDVGCATAHLATFFSDKKYVGLDPCKELLAYVPKQIQTICASGEHIPFMDASYDAVLSLTALHNYSDPLQGVRELFRVSKKLVFIGVLRKSAYHDSILAEIQLCAKSICRRTDIHDTLLFCHKL